MKTQSGSDVVGRHIIVGCLALALMTLVLALISENLVNHRPLTVLDAQLSDWLQLHRTPFLTTAMLAITSLGASAIVTCLTAGFVIYLLSRHRYYWITAMLPSVIGGMLLNRLLKLAFQRPRPSFTDPILTLSGYSFPSGHTMAATVFFGFAAAYFVAQTPEWRRRAPIIVASSLIIGLVAFSRMYLGAHYLSDVLAAVAEGLAWLSLCLTVVHSVWLIRNRAVTVGSVKR